MDKERCESPSRRLKEWINLKELTDRELDNMIFELEQERVQRAAVNRIIKLVELINK